MQPILNRNNSLLRQRFVLKQECQLFQSTTGSLRVHEVDEAQLEEDPAAVDGEVLPVDGLERDRVDVVGEEAADLAENLLDAYAARAHVVGEEFDEVGCGVVSTVIWFGVRSGDGRNRE